MAKWPLCTIGRRIFWPFRPRPFFTEVADLCLCKGHEIFLVWVLCWNNGETRDISDYLLAESKIFNFSTFKVCTVWYGTYLQTDFDSIQWMPHISWDDSAKKATEKIDSEIHFQIGSLSIHPVCLFLIKKFLMPFFTVFFYLLFLLFFW